MWAAEVHAALLNAKKMNTPAIANSAVATIPMNTAIGKKSSPTLAAAEG